jgi:hypothetical protein
MHPANSCIRASETLESSDLNQACPLTSMQLCSKAPASSLLSLQINPWITLKLYNLNHIRNPRLFPQRRRQLPWHQICVTRLNKSPAAFAVAGTEMQVAGQARLPCRSVATSAHVLLAGPSCQSCPRLQPPHGWLTLHTRTAGSHLDLPLKRRLATVSTDSRVMRAQQGIPLQRNDDHISEFHFSCLMYLVLRWMQLTIGLCVCG